MLSGETRRKLKEVDCWDDNGRCAAPFRRADWGWTRLRCAVQTNLVLRVLTLRGYKPLSKDR